MKANHSQELIHDVHTSQKAWQLSEVPRNTWLKTVRVFFRQSRQTAEMRHNKAVFAVTEKSKTIQELSGRLRKRSK